MGSIPIRVAMEDKTYISREVFESEVAEYSPFSHEMAKEMEEEGITFYLDENGVAQIDASEWKGTS